MTRSILELLLNFIVSRCACQISDRDIYTVIKLNGRKNLEIRSKIAQLLPCNGYNFYFYYFVYLYRKEF